MAPPTPCSTRAATSCANERDNAHASEPRLNNTTAARNTYRVPNLADSQPDAGITIATASAYDATTACMRSGDSPRPVAIDGSAVLTIVVSSICMNAAIATSQSIGRSEGRDDSCVSGPRAGEYMSLVGAIEMRVGAIPLTFAGAICLVGATCPS